MSNYDRVSKFGKEHFALDVKFKDESLLMKVLGKALFFNPSFMTNYTTTLGSTVYFPTKKWVDENSEDAACILAHELIHVSDSQEIGMSLFAYSYLFPQVLSLLALLAIVSSNLWLLWLLCLAPLPAPFRTYWELRGYAITDAVLHKTRGTFTSSDFLAKQFTTGAYYFMWPFRNDIISRIEENRNMYVHGSLNQKMEVSEAILECFEQK